MWILNTDTSYVSTLAPKNDPTNWVEFEAPAGADGADGVNGVDGKSLELSKSPTAIQWRQVGETWQNLVLLADITGPQGPQGIPGVNGTDGVDGTDGINGTNGVDGVDGAPGTPGTNGTNGIDGIDGKSVELTKTATAINWRQEGSTWQELVTLADITGPQGIPGTPGTNGTNGTNGVDGAPGLGVPDPTGNAGKFVAVNAGATGYELVAAPSGGGGGGGSSSINAVLGNNFINQQITQTQFLVTPTNLGAGTVYRVNATIMLRPTNTANGVTLGFSGSFGALLFLVRARYRGASGTDITRVCHDKSGTIVLPNHEMGNEGNLLLIEGFIHAQTSGTLALTFAVNTAWDYCAVVKGSFLQLEPVGTASLA